METLEDKIDTPNDGMENVKLDMVCSYDFLSIIQYFYLFVIFYKIFLIFQ